MLVNKLRFVSFAAPVAVLFCTFFYCTKIGPEKEWNNPLDPQGISYFPPLVFSRSDTIISFNREVSFAVTASGTITGYSWSSDGGRTWDTISGDNTYRTTWRLEDVGVHSLWYRAIDNHGLVSAPDSFKVEVHRYAPAVIAVRDSSVSQMTNVVITFSASDTNGTITKYYWKYPLNAVGWTDSSENPEAVFFNSKGGPLSVVWAAVDDDGIMTLDTFVLIFNRAPVSVQIHEIAKKFVSFNYDEYKGTLFLAFNSEDPDGESDSLYYRLLLGISDSSQVLAYEGSDTVFTDWFYLPNTIYSWKLRVTDSFGDSCEASGSFITPGPPSTPDGMVFIRSKGQTFTMGQSGFADYELPLHPVTFTYYFWMDSTEVTDKAYHKVLGIPDTDVSNDMYPVSTVNWFDAVLYCNARSKSEQRDTVYRYTAMTGKPGKNCILENLLIDMSLPGYRLPTEAEWEYACRASSVTLYYWGNNLSTLTDNAWIKSNSGTSIHRPAQKTPNKYGLYDMAGNVWEWCNDWFEEGYYFVSPAENPSGPQTGTRRVIRGGSYQHSDYFTQSGTRSRLRPQDSNSAVGFRVVLLIK